MPEFKATILNDDGEEYEVTFPAVNEVCDECGGDGFVLCEGMRGHAYTPEEFNEAFFDDEDREEYFKRGGRYDVVCPRCKGKNVVAVPDEKQMTPSQREDFAIWEEQQSERAAMDADDRRTMRMESGCWDG